MALLIAATSACGGAQTGSPDPAPASAANTTSLVVDAGPAGIAGIVNTVYVSVTVCVPGGSPCQTIDHISLDTGSSGLRIVASALSTLPALPLRTDASGNSLAECMQFADGYSWGSVRIADVQIGGETAPAQSLQLVGDSALPNVPANCSALGIAEDTAASLGANGILGVGVFRQDCGALCAAGIPATPLYYSCPAGSPCQGVAVALSDQLQNPVWQLPVDNAGVLVQLPTIDPAGATTVSGTLLLGIDSRSNNRLAGAAIQSVDSSTGTFMTQYQGQSYPQSFFDSGSSALFFDDASLPVCSSPGLAPGYYCPASVQSRSASVLGAGGGGTPGSIGFSIANANALLGGNSSFTAFANLAAPNPLGTGYFTWGAPFFFGRSVYLVIEGQSTSAGIGPFTAYR